MLCVAVGVWDGNFDIFGVIKVTLNETIYVTSNETSLWQTYEIILHVSRRSGNPLKGAQNWKCLRIVFTVCNLQEGKKGLLMKIQLPFNL